MKKMFIFKNTKFKVLVFLLIGAGLFLWNCQEEDIPFELQEKKGVTVFNTVSKTKAQELLENHRKEMTSSVNISAKSTDNGESVLKITPDWDTFELKELGFTAASLSKVEAEINVPMDFDFRLMFFQINDFYLKVIESTVATETFEDGSIKTGKVYYHELDGKFIEGYVVEDGLATKRLVLKAKEKKAGFLSFLSLFFEQDDCDENLVPDDPFCSEDLEEIVIKVKKRVEASITFIIIKTEPPHISADDDEIPGLGGGGGGSPGPRPSLDCIVSGKRWNRETETCECRYGKVDDGDGNCVCLDGKIENSSGDCVCPEGQIEDGSGNCISDPCDDIETQLTDADLGLDFKAKVKELKRKTRLTYESGYMQKTDGSYVEGQASDNGHSLTFDEVRSANSRGYIHTHVSGVRIFSPKDLITFLAIVKYSTSGSSSYGTVIASTGNYTLKFTGNKDHIKSSGPTRIKTADEYRLDYIEIMKKSKKNLAKGFLKFVKKHIKIDGIRLYKINDDNTVEEKTLNSGNRVTTTNCNE